MITMIDYLQNSKITHESDRNREVGKKGEKGGKRGKKGEKKVV